MMMGQEGTCWEERIHKEEDALQDFMEEWDTGLPNDIAQMEERQRQEAQSRTSPQLSSWQTAAGPGVPGATNVQLCHCTKSCGGGEPEQIGAGRVASAQEGEGVQVVLPQGLGSQS